MDPDEVAYRKNVRTMVIVLAAILVTIFATIFIPPYLNPSHDVFPRSVSYDSGFGFTMHLTLNSTAFPPAGHLLFTGWINSSSDSVENVTASNSWAFSQGLLWERQCTNGWPMGIGVMRGHYTQDNYTLGTLLQPEPSHLPCPFSEAPQYFLLYPRSSEALASIGGNPSRWNILMDVPFGQNSLSSSALPAGVYTAVLADEWGDVLTANFIVS